MVDKLSFSEIDHHFAQLMGRLSHDHSPEFVITSRFVSAWTHAGHTCLDLKQFAGIPWNQYLELEPHLASHGFPPLEQWVELLRNNYVVGQPGDKKPLILDEGGRLYLYRYWEYEHQLAQRLTHNTLPTQIEALNDPILQQGLTRLFPEDRSGETNWQKVAALTALLQRFCVISGGPGTGKTSTVVKVLALLLEQAQSQPLRIALAAPTGKAAARLQESIHNAKHHLACEEDIKAAIPENVYTLHRLLQPLPYSPYFRFNAKHPLAYDVIVVDEASMVDMALMNKLFQAIPTQARLILLGDKDQLASVESGAVLGDLCELTPNNTFSPDFAKRLQSFLPNSEIASTPSKQALNDAVVLLTQTYRFRQDSGIGAWSLAVRDGKSQQSWELLSSVQYEDIHWVQSIEHLKTFVIEQLSEVLNTQDPAEALMRLGRFQILCALREGPQGVIALNRWVERLLQQKQLIPPLHPKQRWYAYQPILITQNHKGLELFNGDIGILLPSPEDDGALRAFFQGPQGLRKVLPSMLPPHETVYAMTIHKSQGSEFDRLLLVLPEQDSPILTRELLYTGITRAKKEVFLLSNPALFKTAVNRRIQRTSGLKIMLNT